MSPIYRVVALGSHPGAGQVVIANDNAPGQIVISGENTALNRAMDLAREAVALLDGAQPEVHWNASCPPVAPTTERMTTHLSMRAAIWGKTSPI